MTVELTTFLPCIRMNKTEYNEERCRCFTVYDVKSKHSILVHIWHLKGAVAFLTGHWIATVTAKLSRKRQMMQMRSLNRQDTIDVRYAWNEFEGGPHNFVLVWTNFGCQFSPCCAMNWFWFQCTKIRTQFMDYAPLHMHNRLLNTAVCL